MSKLSVQEVKTVLMYHGGTARIVEVFGGGDFFTVIINLPKREHVSGIVDVGSGPGDKKDRALRIAFEEMQEIKPVKIPDFIITKKP